MSRIRNSSLGVLIGALAGAPAQIAHADDTEVYLGASSSVGVRPNVLFVLDTSGSMSDVDPGQTKDRLELMQEAFKSVLDQTSNVNVGLMRFSDPGGPILFPVSYIDGDATKVGSSADITLRVQSSTDDAEQLVSSSAVKTDSLQLELVSTRAFGTEFSPSLTSTDDDDDADLSDPDNMYFRNDAAVALGPWTGGGVNYTDIFGGLRFTQVPQQTKNAVVQHASVSVRAAADDSGSVNARFRAQTHGDPPDFPSSASGITDALGVCDPGTTSSGDPKARWWCRIGTARQVTDYVDWDVPAMINGDWYESPDLGAMVENVFARVDWTGGTGNANNLVLLYRAGFPTSGGNARRFISSRGAGAGSAPVLNVEYVESGAPSGTQKIALRFTGLAIPRGATIDEAVLELTSRTQTNAPVSMKIYGEASDDAATFAATSNDIGARDKTTAVVDWDLTSADTWDRSSTVQTPDIASVLQEVVNRPHWCGGNDIALIIEADGVAGMRSVYSFDNDPGQAPALRINFDESQVYAAGQGCIAQTVQRQVEASADDAEEKSSGNVGVTSQTLGIPREDGNARTVGLRFRGLEIPQGAIINHAELNVRSLDDYSTAHTANWIIKGEKVPDAPEFRPQDDDITDRTPTAASVDFWAPGVPVSDGERFSTSDLSTIVKEIVDQPGWVSGNALNLILDGASAAEVEVASFDRNASYAAILRVTYQVNLGDLGTSSGASPIITVRQRLKELVDDFDHEGYTPIVDTLYEASLYYRGDPVLYGLERGDDSAVQPLTRVSHFASYVNGKISRPGGCEDTNLSSSNCKKEKIVPHGGTPTYISPLEEGCQTNFTVLLTDGRANNNHSQALIQAMTGKSACAATFSDNTSVEAGEACGLELVDYMNSSDQSATVDGDNTVGTYTIGFNIDSQFLKDLATDGGGKYFEAKDATELTKSFETIFADILKRTTSFAAPSLSVNAFNRLFHRNEVYFSLFKPDGLTRWNGNVKKYQICESATNGCTVGEIMDAHDPPVAAIGSDDRILDSALSIWSESEDGSSVIEGGAGGELFNQSSRTVYTYLGGTDTATSVYSSTAAPQDLTSAVSLGSHELADDSGTEGVIDDLEPLVSGTEAQLEATRVMLGFPGPSVSSLNATEKASLQTELREHINWVRAIDVDDEDNDGDTAENRYAFNDPLHSTPVAVTFGAED
ncbi:MAG: VWA domain-containing protein, partial [Gammaproteobacteria bacterium]